MATPSFHRPLLLGVARALHSIFVDGRHADKVIEFELKTHKKWGSRDRRFFAETVYDINRWCRRLLWCLGRDISDSQPWPWDQLIEVYIKMKSEGRWPEDDVPRAVFHSLPDWLFEYGEQELGSRWEREIAALNLPAPAFLRVNRLKVESEQVIEELFKEGILAQPVPDVPDALKLVERKNVFRTSAFEKGYFEMQDAGSQQIAPLLQVGPGHCVVDACAGAGGKTLHLAALMQNKGRLIAMDVHERKLQELKKRAARNGVHNLTIRPIDGTKAIKRLHDSADRLLLDVPCSGSGVWRRNPDGRWKLTSAELDQLRVLQREILTSYSSMVAVGGLMVYATCSIFPSENDQQIEWFLSSPEGQGWSLERDLHIWPSESQFDGFFAAVLRRVR